LFPVQDQSDFDLKLIIRDVPRGQKKRDGLPPGNTAFFIL